MNVKIRMTITLCAVYVNGKFVTVCGDGPDDEWRLQEISEQARINDDDVEFRDVAGTFEAETPESLEKAP